MQTKEQDLVLRATLDVSGSLDELMTAAGVVWVSSQHREEFLAHDWPTHDERAPSLRSYLPVSPDDPVYATTPLYRALLSGRSVWPATLHEALALAAHRHELGWWSQDFVVVGTRVNGHLPWVSIRKDEIYLGAELVSPYDPPSYFLVSF